MTGAGVVIPQDFFTHGANDTFLIQDPFGLREVIQPVVSISQSEDKITGLGTCFQVSPWLWLTAHHVVRHSSTSIFPDNEVGAVGFSMGLVYGTVGFVTTDIFGEVRQRLTYENPEAAHLNVLPGPKPPDILIDVAALRVNIQNLKRKPLISPLPIGREGPKIGDAILAIGYPILGSKFKSQSSRLIFEENMYGASGVVTAIHPKGTSESKPWPTFEISGNWESGMSGGPVINTHGEVVGVVSSSLPPYEGSPGVGFAVALPNIPLPHIAPELDIGNPGFIKGYGVFSSEKIVGFFPSLEIAQMSKAQSSELQIRRISLNPKTEVWVDF